MIDLLLRASTYGLAVTDDASARHPIRSVIEPGCFAPMLRSHPPYLTVMHNYERAYGTVVDHYDDDRHLILVARTSAPEIEGPIRTGRTPIFRGVPLVSCSISWHGFDVDTVRDSRGVTNRHFSGHCFEVSLTTWGKDPDARILGWREVR